MTFLSPGYLWLFFSLIPLIAIYLLKVRPERRYTSVLFLWDKIFEEKKSSALFRRLRDWLSLLMLMLIFSMIILALAHPVFSSDMSKRNLILIIDNSAGMAAGKAGSSRLDEAKELAANIVSNLSASQKVILAAVADNFEIVVNSSSNPRELLNGIRRIAPTELPFKADALEFLNRRKAFIGDSRAILLSGGGFGGADKLKSVEQLKIGQPLENAGIVAFDLVRLTGSGGGKLGIYFKLASSFKASVDADVIISNGTQDNIVKVCPVKIEPGDNRAEVYVLDNAPDGKWFARLDLKDVMDMDNIALGFINPLDPVKVEVGLVPERFFVELCVRAFQDTDGVCRLVENNPDVLVSSGGINTSSKDGKYILFNPSGDSPFWSSVGKTLEPAAAKTVLQEHPGIKFCRFDGMIFFGVKQLQLPQGAVVLATTLDGVPLIYKVATPTGIAYVLNFDPVASDFFLNLNFPLLTGGLLADLTGRENDWRTVYRTGERIKLESLPVKINFVPVLTYDKGEQIEVDNLLLSKIGFYETVVDGKRQTYAASLLNESASELDNSKLKTEIKPIESGMPLRSFLLITALIILTLECVLYHLRKVG